MSEPLGVMAEVSGAAAQSKLETSILEALEMACRYRDTEAAERIFSAWSRLVSSLRRPYQANATAEHA